MHNEIFHKIEKKDINEEIFSQFQLLIKRGILKPGDQLPTENELAKNLSVSRPVLREALNGLKALGLIKSIQGKGTFLNNDYQNSISKVLRALWTFDRVSSKELIELRLIIERASVTLAVERINEEFLARLRSKYNALINKSTNDEEFVQDDIDFHRLIAESTCNKAVFRTLDSVRNLLIELSEIIVKIPGQRIRSNEDHHNILLAIESRNAHEARKQITNHLKIYENIIG